MVELTHWMQFEARVRLVTKLYYVYCAGANERSNEKMRQCISPTWIKSNLEDNAMLTLVKESLVYEVSLLAFAERTLKLTPAGEGLADEDLGTSSIVFDKKTGELLNWNLPFEDMVGRIVVCTFEASPAQFDGIEGRGPLIGLGSLLIDTLIKRESTFWRPARPFEMKKRTESLDVLKLSSCLLEGGWSITILPCPRFEFLVHLTRYEYKACKALKANTVFKFTVNMKNTE